MIEILQTRSPKRYAELFARTGVAQKSPAVSEIRDGDTVISFCIYHFETKPARVVLDYIPEETGLAEFDGLARAVLFLAMLRGMDAAEFSEQTVSPARTLRLVKSDENYVESITEILDNCKNCKEGL